MTIGQPKRLTLQEELKLKMENERKAQAEFAKKKEREGDSYITPIELPTPAKVEIKMDSPPQTNDQQLKDYKAFTELESIKAGYKSLKEREQALTDGEKEFQIGIEQLAKERETFEKEQRSRVDAYNLNVKNYNDKYELLKTTQKEADKLMQEAMQAKSQANAIIKAQKESEKATQEKLEAYDANMTECVEVFEEISNILMRQNDIRCSGLGKILNHDVALIQRMQNRKSSLTSIAELIGTDVDRITELCGVLQDSRGDHGKLLYYLLTNTDFISKSLIIEWTPSNRVALI